MFPLLSDSNSFDKSLQIMKKKKSKLTQLKYAKTVKIALNSLLSVWNRLK
jgi:hypothetical protein